MASKKTDRPRNKSLTPRESADYTQDILVGLGKLAESNSQTLLAHLLEMARMEAIWLSHQ